jgi:hypothetical protein
MPTERLAMRHVRDVMRLKAAGVPIREIARRVGAAPSTVRLTIRRLEGAGLTWPLADDVTDAVLEAKLFAGAGTKQGHRRHAEPDWAAVHRELKRKHVTLSIIWEEYIAVQPDGYRYSRYVAAKFMLRLPGRARDIADFPGPMHNIERGSLGSIGPSEMPSVTAMSVAGADLSGR